jgi:hypothetical protein
METAPQSSPDRRKLAHRSDQDRPQGRPDQRSRLTNHRDLLPDLDGRSAAARRFRDLVNGFISDQGGLENCSEVKLGLLRRLAALTVQSEMLESAAANGQSVDITMLCTLASTSLRLSSRIGIERTPKPVMDLQTYLSNLQQKQETITHETGPA